jgi:hypothetical protein
MNLGAGHPAARRMNRFAPYPHSIAGMDAGRRRDIRPLAFDGAIPE